MFWLRPFFALITLIISLFIFVAPVKAEESSPPKDLQIKVETPDTSQYPTVTVTVTVADKSGAPVLGLAPKDFGILVDTDPTLPVNHLESLESTSLPLYLVLALDRSFLVDANEQWQKTIEIATLVKNKMRPGDQLRFVVFSNDVKEISDLDGLKMEVPDSSNTALHRAIQTSIEEVHKLRNHQNGIEQIIIVSNSPDNTWRSATIPPSFEQLEQQLSSTENESTPQLNIYCYGIAPQFSASADTNALNNLAASTGAKGGLQAPPDLEQVKKVVAQLLQDLPKAARYKLSFQATAKVNVQHDLQIEMNGLRYKSPPFKPDAKQITVQIDTLHAKNTITETDEFEVFSPAQPNLLTFAVTNNSGIKPFTTQVTLNDVISPTYSFNDTKILLQLSRLAPGITYKLLVSMTDSIGNSGNQSKTFKLAQQIDVDIEPKVSATYAVSRSTLADLVYTVTARGESPITVTFLVSNTNATKFITEMHDIGNAVPFTIGVPLADYISKTYSETYLLVQPKCPSDRTTLQNLATRLPENLQPPVAWLLSLGEPVRCMLPTHRAIWTNLMTAQLPLTDTFKLSIDAKDRVGQQSSYVGDPINFDISYATPPTLIRRLFYYWPVFLLDILALLLLLLFGFWLRRRFVLAHEMTYDLKVVNAGNLATCYELCALQPIAKSRGLLSFQPDTLHFSFLYTGKTLEQMPTSAQKLTVSMPLTSQDVVTLDDKTLQTAQQVNRIDDRQSQYEIHEKLRVQGGEQPYAMTLGYSPHFQTELVAPGDSLPLQLKIQTHRRHWWRKSYTFVIMSQPQVADSEWQKTTASQTIRFGNILSPKRIDKLPSRQNTDSSSTSAIRSPVAVNPSGN